MVISARDIKDSDSLEQWLKEWPTSQGMNDDEARQVAVQIVHRAVLRAWPIAWDRFSLQSDAKDDVFVLACLRCLTISAGASICPLEALGSFAAQAMNAARASKSIEVGVNVFGGGGVITAKVTNAVFNAAVLVNDAATINTNAIESSITAMLRFCNKENFEGLSPTEQDAIEKSQLVAKKSEHAAGIYWREVLADALGFEQEKLGSLTSSLWHQNYVSEIELAERRFKNRTRAKSPVWDFWLGFWEKAKRGETPPWEMLLEIAEIPEEDWDAGPVRIAELIAGIELDFAEKATLLGEKVDLNPETGKIFVSDHGPDNTRRLESCVLKLKEIEALVSQYDNYKGMLRAELFLIRRAMEHHPTNPVILHNNAKSARRVLAANVASGVCLSFEQEPVLGLLDTTLLDVQTVMEDEPSVVEARGSEADVSQVLASKEIQETIVAVAKEIAEHAEGRLEVELVEDAEIVADTSNPEALKEAAAKSFASRSIRVWIAARYANFKGALDETSDVAKKVSIISGVSGAGYVVWAKLAESSGIAEFIQKLIALLS